jgi:hypothetical protein
MNCKYCNKYCQNSAGLKLHTYYCDYIRNKSVKKVRFTDPIESKPSFMTKDENDRYKKLSEVIQIYKKEIQSNTMNDKPITTIQSPTGDSLSMIDKLTMRDKQTKVSSSMIDIPNPISPVYDIKSYTSYITSEWIKYLKSFLNDTHILPLNMLISKYPMLFRVIQTKSHQVLINQGFKDSEKQYIDSLLYNISLNFKNVYPTIWNAIQIC